jgi:hypothetical protein
MSHFNRFTGPVARPGDASNPRLAVLALIAATALWLPGSAFGQGCPPAGESCAAGVLQVIDFESFPAGTPVEGLGAVHPDLAITSLPSLATSCTTGSAMVIEELNNFPYDSYGTGSGVNGCLDGVHGFGDDHDCVLDYEFTFSPGTTVSCFSIRMLDYGDYFPFGGQNHVVRLRAWAGTTPVDQDQLTISGGSPVPTGDACTTGAGDPGNVVLNVAGTGITRVVLAFDAFPDPNVGFDDIQFCMSRGTVPVAARPWSFVKGIYRE